MKKGTGAGVGGRRSSFGAEPQALCANLPLARLLQLVMLLQTERCPNARELAEACEVSRRTIYRDLSTLAAAGIVVDYVADRRGYQLVRSQFLQPMRLHEKEALALLMISRQWDGEATHGLLSHAQLAVDKVIQTLPQELRASLVNCSELISDVLVVEADSKDRRELFETLLDAITHRRQIRLWYQEEGQVETQATKLGLYRLPRIQGEWVLVGRSSFHRRVVVVPFSRIARIEPTTDSYALPPRFQLRRFFEQSRRREEGASLEVVLRISRRLANQLDRLPGRVLRKPVVEGCDWAEVVIVSDDRESLARSILALGDEVEVVGPADLRSAVGRLAARVAKRHTVADASPALDMKTVVISRSKGLMG